MLVETTVNRDNTCSSLLGSFFIDSCTPPKIADYTISLFDLFLGCDFTGLPAQYFICDHMRCPEYFTETISGKCTMHGYYCKSQSDLQSGRCVPGSSEEVPVMGYDADKHRNDKRLFFKKYYMMTNTAPSFCGKCILFSVCACNWEKSIAIVDSHCSVPTPHIKMLVFDMEGPRVLYSPPFSL